MLLYIVETDCEIITDLFRMSSMWLGVMDLVLDILLYMLNSYWPPPSPLTYPFCVMWCGVTHFGHTLACLSHCDMVRLCQVPSVYLIGLVFYIFRGMWLASCDLSLYIEFCFIVLVSGQAAIHLYGVTPFSAKNICNWILCVFVVLGVNCNLSTYYD